MMSTIATTILRDLQAQTAGVSSTSINKGEPKAAAQSVIRRLCEQARGIRIGSRKWVFPDGSELQV